MQSKLPAGVPETQSLQTRIGKHAPCIAPRNQQNLAAHKQRNLLLHNRCTFITMKTWLMWPDCSLAALQLHNSLVHETTLAMCVYCPLHCHKWLTYMDPAKLRKSVQEVVKSTAQTGTRATGERGLATELELETYALLRSFSHASHWSRLRSSVVVYSQHARWILFLSWRQAWHSSKTLSIQRLHAWEVIYPKLIEFICNSMNVSWMCSEDADNSNSMQLLTYKAVIMMQTLQLILETYYYNSWSFKLCNIMHSIANFKL